MKKDIELLPLIVIWFFGYVVIGYLLGRFASFFERRLAIHDWTAPLVSLMWPLYLFIGPFALIAIGVIKLGEWAYKRGQRRDR